MLRFGRPILPSYKKWLKNYNYNQHLKVRKQAILTPSNTSLPATKFVLYIPNHWSVFLLGSKTKSTNLKLIYLTSTRYYFKIPYILNLMSFEFDIHTSSINITLLTKTHYVYLYLKQLQILLFTFSQVQFTRMKFRGKGYYIYKTLRNTIAPNFGYAHRVYVYAYFVSLKFLSKTAIILFGLTKTDLFTVGHNFKITRPINIFTGRGVRFSRQIVYKKTGKVSSYR